MIYKLGGISLEVKAKPVTSIWMFHADCQDGKIFDYADITDLKKKGWVENPEDLKQKRTRKVSNDSETAN